MSGLHFDDTAEHAHLHGTWVEKLDPRAKLVSALSLAAWIGALPQRHAGLLGLVGTGLVVVAALQEIPPRTLIVRASAALPFVLVPAVVHLLVGSFDVATTATLAGRAFVAAMTVTLLVSVTQFSAILNAASSLGMPDLLVQTTALVYRYLFLLRERASATAASAQARGYGVHTPHRFAVAGSMLGSLLLHGLDRADRVQSAMLARGYTGRFPMTRPLKMTATDWLVGACVTLSCAGSLFWLR